MTDELFIPSGYADTTVDHEHDPSSGLRVYKSSPEDVAIQIRTNRPVSPSGRGKTRPAFSTIRLQAAELDKLITHLKALRAEIEE